MNSTTTTNNNHNRKIQILPFETRSIIQAGQVIGSTCRAIEELCRNSIVHGHATEISVTLGDCYYTHPHAEKEEEEEEEESCGDDTGNAGQYYSNKKIKNECISLLKRPVQNHYRNPRIPPNRQRRREFYLEVSDNGIGIEKDALEKYIGTHSCSSSSSTALSTICMSTTRGEFLKSLPCLCYEMNITSTTAVHKGSMNSTHNNPTDESESESPTYVSYQKTLQQGGLYTLFQIITDDHPHHHQQQQQQQRYSNDSSPSSSSGTKISLYGLFHNQGIRRQEYSNRRIIYDNNNSGKNNSGNSIISSGNGVEKWKEVQQARFILSQMAIAYPWITFRLLLVTVHNKKKNNDDTDRVEDTLWNYHYHSLSSSSLSNHTLSSSSSSSHEYFYAEKLNQLLGKIEHEHYTLLSIHYSTPQPHDQYQDKDKGTGEAQQVYQNQNQNTISTTTTTARVKPTRLFQEIYDDRGDKSIISSSHGNYPILHNEQGSIPPLPHSWHLLGAIAIPTIVLQQQQQHQHGDFSSSSSLFFESHSSQYSHHHHNNTNSLPKKIDYFFINGRPVKHYSIRNLLQDILVKEKDTKIHISFILHLFCPESYVDISIDDQYSFVNMSRSQRMIEGFIQKAFKYHLIHNNNTSAIPKTTRMTYDKKGNHQSVFLRRENEFNTNITLLNQHRHRHHHRILQKTSRVIMAPSSFHTNVSISNISNKKMNTQDTYNDPISTTTSTTTTTTTSPFDNAFILDQSVQEIMSESSKQMTDTFTDIFQGSLEWTRQRIQPTTTNINTDISTGTTIPINRNELSHSTFIAQLDRKFLVTRYDGNICLIDQHAADERIGLEKIEQAVLSIIRGQCDKDGTIHMSKLGTIETSKIIQSRNLEKWVDIDLTAFQRLALLANEEWIRKWKFDFLLMDHGNMVRVLSVPEFYGKKLATVQDFLHFVDELSDPSCLVLIFQSIPSFVQRYLSSLACRYAFMFGDLLSDEQSRGIISTLSQCDKPSVCAHGRPSIINILDGHDDRWQRDIPYFRSIRINK